MTSPVLVYVVGMPGAGKSTLMAELTAECGRLTVTSRVPHDALAVRGRIVACELGRRTGPETGTDGLNHRVQGAAESWIAAVPYPLVLGEGERLANRSFLNAAQTSGYRVRVLYVDIARDVADARREAEPATTGDEMRWLAGSSARAASIAAAAQSTGWLAGILDGHKPPMALAHAARRLVPELESLT